MIDKLITALSIEVEMSAAEIADTIWLALQMQEFPSESVSSGFPVKTEDEREIKKPENQLDRQPFSKTLDLEKTPNPLPTERKAGIYPRNEQQTSKSSNLSFKVPDAPSLREPLTLARALRPLMRRIPSGRELLLDEAATIQRIADEGLWIPVLKSTVEPWLDLELVVDEAISMQIWRYTIRELEQLLKNYGIFRDVRVWGLIKAETEQVQIRRGIGAMAKNQTRRSPKELIDPTGRRLVLVVSDCVSSLWRNGELTSVLELWAKQGSMAIIQMLPKWLWKRTALGRASEVQLRGLAPGVFNQKLIAKEVSLWDGLEEEMGVKVPIFTLEPDKVATWAQMFSGKGSIWTIGYVFRLNAPVKRERELFNLNHSELSAEQRVQAFRVTASPMARKLAGLLASAPVISLPIVRLIREALLKDSQQIHVAEVFLGGLLKPLSEINGDTNPDYVQYEFMDKVRELLVDSVPSEYVLNVVDEVSKYVAKKVGLSLEDFAAVLRNPQQIKDGEITGKVAAFATVTSQILRCLGQDYTKVADDLEIYSKIDSQKDIPTTLNSFSDVEYQVGGCLTPESPSYIKRKADRELYNALKEGQLCIVFAPIQMGKTSLILKIINSLKQERFAYAVVNLASIGNKKITFKEFCYLLINILVREFNLSNIFDLKKWWEAELEFISGGTVFHNFIKDVLVKAVNQQTLVFIDELDWIIDTGFTRDFLLLLISLHEHSKTNNNNYPKFVLSTTLDLSKLYSLENLHISPFNIDVGIKLEEFTYEEALPLADGLTKKTKNPQELLIEILEWTGGQPFLTQKLCQLVKKSDEYVADVNKKVWLDNLVKTKIIENWQEQDSPQHLLRIENRILNSKKANELLSLYQSILDLDVKNYIAHENLVMQELILIGLVVKKGENLKVANKIYAEIFNHKWIKQSLFTLPKNIRNFEFETITVNHQGERIKNETKQAQYFAENLPKNIVLEMVVIPSGIFIMGSPIGEGNEREKPQHQVKLQEFCMAKYPVTQEQWRAVAYSLPQYNLYLDYEPSKVKGANRPVDRVSWDEAIEFCNRLSKYTGRHYRLPSESEWEYACRAGTNTPFSFGETLTPDLAIYGSNIREWSIVNYDSNNSKIRRKFFNNFGLYDMHGSVWEWCADIWCDNYEDKASYISTLIDENYKRPLINEDYKRKYFPHRVVVRGGSWGKQLEYCRSAYRQSEASNYKSEYNGFRIVCGIELT